MEDATPHTNLYRLYDKNNILLYVGITTQGTGRLVQHADAKSWWPLVDRVAVQHERRIRYSAPTGTGWASRPITEYDELNAILNEFPVFNIAGVPWRTRCPSKRQASKERLRNRAEIMGAVARLNDVGVDGRLAVLEQTEPLVYKRALRVAVRSIQREVTELTLAREQLVAAEEFYFNDFLDAVSVWDACAEYGGDPADYPYVRHQRSPQVAKQGASQPLQASQASQQRSKEREIKLMAAVAEIRAREKTWGNAALAGGLA